MANKLQHAINKQTNIYTTYTTRSGSTFSQQSLANKLQQAINKQTNIYTTYTTWSGSKFNSKYCKQKAKQYAYSIKFT